VLTLETSEASSGVRVVGIPMNRLTYDWVSVSDLQVDGHLPSDLNISDLGAGVEAHDIRRTK
jgi:hypothetical protein